MLNLRLVKILFIRTIVLIKLTHINELIAEYVDRPFSHHSRGLFTPGLQNMFMSTGQRRVTEIYQVVTRLDRFKRSINGSMFDNAVSSS